MFRARYAKDDGYLVLLPEHKSEPARWTPMQLLSLETRIWESYREEHPNASLLPPILPVVVHHGAGGWRGPRRFGELVHALPGLAARSMHQLDFELLVDDLALESPEQVLARPMSIPARLALFCLRQARQDLDLLDELEQRAWDPLAELAQKKASRALTTIWTYIRATDVPAERLLDLSRRLGPAAEEAFMTSAQILLKEGEAKGEAKGRAEVLLRLLGRKFGALPAEVEGRIRTASIDQLDRWLDRVLTATMLDEVFG